VYFATTIAAESLRVIDAPVFRPMFAKIEGISGV
jgi:hypothetical protein